MENCKKCHASIRPGDKFCPNCGTRIEEPKVFCHNCGTCNTSSLTHCSNCGTPLRHTTAGEAQVLGFTPPAKQPALDLSSGRPKSTAPIPKKSKVWLGITGTLVGLALLGCLYGLISLVFYDDNYRVDVDFTWTGNRDKHEKYLLARGNARAHDIFGIIRGSSSKGVSIERYWDTDYRLSTPSQEDRDEIRQKVEDEYGEYYLRNEAISNYRSKVGRFILICFAGVIVFGAISIALAANIAKRRRTT